MIQAQESLKLVKVKVKFAHRNYEPGDIYFVQDYNDMFRIYNELKGEFTNKVIDKYQVNVMSKVTLTHTLTYEIIEHKPKYQIMYRYTNSGLWQLTEQYYSSIEEYATTTLFDSRVGDYKLCLDTKKDY